MKSSPGEMVKLRSFRNTGILFLFKNSRPDFQDLLKGTVLPDIGFYFDIYKSKSVLSVGPLLIFTFSYFVVPEIFKIIFQHFY
jgi:hypothetical protein